VNMGLGRREKNISGRVGDRQEPLSYVCFTRRILAHERGTVAKKKRVGKKEISDREERKGGVISRAPSSPQG